MHPELYAARKRYLDYLQWVNLQMLGGIDPTRQQEYELNLLLAQYIEAQKDYPLPGMPPYRTATAAR